VIVAVAAFSMRLGAPPAAHAAEFNVDTTADDVTASACNDAALDDCSLRGAILAANALTEPSTIHVPAGTYVLSQSSGCTFTRPPSTSPITWPTFTLCLTRTVTLQGAGADETIIDGDRRGRVLFVAPGGVANVRGVTIRNGLSDRSLGTNPEGGGLLNEGTLVLTDSVVTGNGLDPNATGATGAGIYNAFGAALTLLRSTVAANVAPSHAGGGGISTFLRSMLNVLDSVIRDNTIGSNGGGINNYGGVVTIVRSTLSGNASGGLGGAIANFGTNIDGTDYIGALTIIDSTLSGNTTGSSGGGIFNSFRTTVELNNATITSNRVTTTAGSGGGFATREGTEIAVRNTIIAGNTATSGSAPDCLAENSFRSAGLTSQGYNLVQNTNNCVLVGDTTGNIIGQDPKLGPLADNGGPGKTHALAADSPAVDAGNPSPPGSGGHACTAIDERGINRLQDGDGDGTGRCDIGAFELPRGGGGFSITGIRPSVAGTAGSVVALIYGSDFAEGATVKLVRAGQADIAADTTSRGDDGAVLAASFDLRAKPPGAWDVVVTNPGGASVTLTGAFTIESGGAPQLWADVVGPREIRVGRPARFTVLFGNRGNVDAEAPSLLISLPASIAIGLRFPVVPPPPHPQQVPNDWSESPVTVVIDDQAYVPLIVPVVPAGFTMALDVTVTAPPAALDMPFEIRAEIGGAHLSPERVDLTVQGAHSYAQRVLAVDIPTSLDPQLAEYAMTQVQSMVDGGRTTLITSTGASTDLYSSAQLVQDVARFGAASTAPSGARADPPTAAIRVVSASGPPSPATNLVDRIGDVVESCTMGLIRGTGRIVAFGLEPSVAFAQPSLSSCAELGVGFNAQTGKCRCDTASGFCPGGSSPTNPRASRDPNDKAGASGAGPERFVAEGEPLRYAISFENVETASAAAQEVVITDQLDGSKVDLDTLSLGPISFGDFTVTPPPGLSDYSTTVDLRPAQDLVVGIDAHLDKATGLLAWRFTSIDPMTGQLTEDAVAGFLPPDVNPPEGDGSVVFTIEPKVTGTPICNRASIVFDVNEPILTPQWCNTIDAVLPTSQVSALAPTQSSPDFQIQWSGSDADSGIAGYAIFVSENGGPFSVFLADTTETSATFSGTVGKTYAFYSIARDQAGNVELPASSPDTVTTVGGADVHDLAVTAIHAPRVVKLTAKAPSRTVPITVQVQNRSPHTETVPDPAALTSLVAIEVTPLGGCAAPPSVLSPPRRFPLAMKPKGKLNVELDVTFDCANDPEKSTRKSPGHEDYRLAARVNHAALDRKPDSHPADDVCPRSVTPPFDIDPNPDGKIKDKGCGNTKPDRTRGAPVLVDVVVNR